MTDATQSSWKKWVLLGVMPILALGGLSITSVLPTRLAPLSEEVPPFVSKAIAKPVGICGLNENASAAGCSPVAQSEFEEVEVSFPSRSPKGPKELRGTLSVPKGAAPSSRPAVLLLGGSGPTARDSESPGDLVHKLHPKLPIMKLLAAHLSRQGLVTLRFDKRSCIPCYPELRPNIKSWVLDYRWSDSVLDAKDALEFLRNRPEVAKGSLVVLGHSEGGHLSPLVAEGEPGVAAMVLLAAMLTDFEAGLMDQLRAIRRIRTRQGDLFGATNIYVEERKYDRCMQDARTGPKDKDRVCIGGGVTQQALAEYFALSTKVPSALANFGRPILAIQGSVDRNIQPGTIGDLATLLRGKPADLYMLPAVGHPLDDVFVSPPAIAPIVLSVLDEFLSKVPYRP